MLRVRFLANLDDYRAIHWPVKHPYWCSGYTDTHSVVVAYVDSLDDVYHNWPEASGIDVMQSDLTEYTFTSRFPKPEWID